MAIATPSGIILLLKAQKVRFEKHRFESTMRGAFFPSDHSKANSWRTPLQNSNRILNFLTNYYVFVGGCTWGLRIP